MRRQTLPSLAIDVSLIEILVDDEERTAPLSILFDAYRLGKYLLLFNNDAAPSNVCRV